MCANKLIFSNNCIAFLAQKLLDISNKYASSMCQINIFFETCIKKLLFPFEYLKNIVLNFQREMLKRKNIDIFS